MTEDRLDRAIEAGYIATGEKPISFGQGQDRTFARALIADLINDMDLPDEREHAEWNMCLDEIRSRAGIGGE